MIRKSTISLNESNRCKLDTLDEVFTESKRVINLYIDYLWNIKDFSSKFVKVKADTWLSARLQQCLGKQALEIVKSQRKRKKKTQPKFTRDTTNLDSRFLDIQFDNNTFDVWIKFYCIGNKINLKLPGKKHKHFNKFYNNKWGLKQSARLRKTTKGYFIDMYFEKKDSEKKSYGASVGCDIGYKKLLIFSDGSTSKTDFTKIYDKISRKKQKSKAFDKALVERDNLINSELNHLDLQGVKEIVVEDLKDVKKKTKGKLRKKFVNKLQRWSYPKVLAKLSAICEETGITLTRVNPAYTSQTCSNCGFIHKDNRNNEKFKCLNCNIKMDADYNASVNILHRGVYSPSALSNKFI